MEEPNGRQASETPSSSSFDFYNTQQPAEPAKEQPATVPGLPEQVSLPVDISANGRDEPADADDDNDSSSEMDLSASSRSATPEPEENALHAGVKRKLSDIADANEEQEDATDESTKKPKLSASPKAAAGPGPSIAERLPCELWQQIFLYLSPAMLCRLLRVSKTSNAYLTRIKAQPMPKKEQPRVRVLDSESIWVNARKIYFPNMPRPLARFNEVQMLQLLGGKSCQFCARLPVPSSATTPFNAGPGADGLRVVWPFGIRSCGLCLERNTVKVSSVSHNHPHMPLILARMSRSLCRPPLLYALACLTLSARLIYTSSPR